jgi:hypothetical protein
MRVSQWIGLGLPMAAFGFGAVFFLSGAQSGDWSAPGREAGAGEPAASSVALASAGATPALLVSPAPGAASYPWEEFESILGRQLTLQERDALRDLRVEHGLRLAEHHARMQRGEFERARFEAWRAARSAEFRADVARMLGCSADQVTALLRVPMRSAAVP